MVHDLRGSLGVQAHGDGRQQGLADDGLLIGLQLVEQDPLVGSVLVDEERLIPLLDQDIGPVQLANHPPGDFLRHIQHSLFRFLHALGSFFREPFLRRKLRQGLGHGRAWRRRRGCRGQDHLGAQRRPLRDLRRSRSGGGGVRLGGGLHCL